MLDTIKIKQEATQLCNESYSRNISYDEFITQMQSKYNYLYTNSTTLFDRCVKGDINLQQLDFMLEMINKVNTGADYNTTSTLVGQRLVDIYVKPLIDNNNNNKN